MRRIARSRDRSDQSLPGERGERPSLRPFLVVLPALCTVGALDSSCLATPSRSMRSAFLWVLFSFSVSKPLLAIKLVVFELLYTQLIQQLHDNNSNNNYYYYHT